MEFNRSTEVRKNSSLRCLPSLFHQSGPSSILTCVSNRARIPHIVSDIGDFSFPDMTNRQESFLEKKYVLPTTTFQCTTGTLLVCEAFACNKQSQTCCLVTKSIRGQTSLPYPSFFATFTLLSHSNVLRNVTCIEYVSTKKGAEISTNSARKKMAELYRLRF